MELSVQHEIVSTYSGFLDSRGITNHKITFVPVSEDTCHSIANSLEFEKLTGLHKILSYTYTSNTQLYISIIDIAVIK